MSSTNTKCPYNCRNGKVFNVATKQFVPCPHCGEIRTKEVSEDKVFDLADVSLSDKLHLKKPVTGLNFSMECVIPEYARRELELSSVNEVEAVLQQFVNKALLGEAPDGSYLINLGSKANIDAFVYQYIMKAYKAGISVAPFVTALDILRIRAEDERTEFIAEDAENDTQVHLTDLVKPQICVVLIDTGATQREVDAVRGLIQLRARDNLPTLVFILYWQKRLSHMCHDSDENLYHLAKLVSVKYINNKTIDDGNLSDADDIPMMTSDEFKYMFEGRNSF